MSRQLSEGMPRDKRFSSLCRLFAVGWGCCNWHLCQAVWVLFMFLFPGAEVNAVSYQSQTELHKLYCHNEQPVLDVYEKTKLFLALGKLSDYPVKEQSCRWQKYCWQEAPCAKTEIICLIWLNRYTRNHFILPYLYPFIHIELHGACKWNRILSKW